METAIIPSQDVNKRILTFRKPNGVYASITPWNFPTLIPVELIAPGIAAGNTMVCKPSEWTPIAMANFMQIMADAGLGGVVNVIYGDGGSASASSPDENVDCVASSARTRPPRRSCGPRTDRSSRRAGTGPSSSVRTPTSRPPRGRRLRRLLLRRPGLLRDRTCPRRHACTTTSSQP